MDEAKGLASQIEALILNKFNWELTDRDQGNFDFKNDDFPVVQRRSHST